MQICVKKICLIYIQENFIYIASYDDNISFVQVIRIILLSILYHKLFYYKAKKIYLILEEKYIMTHLTIQKNKTRNSYCKRNILT